MVVFITRTEPENTTHTKTRRRKEKHSTSRRAATRVACLRSALRCRQAPTNRNSSVSENHRRKSNSTSRSPQIPCLRRVPFEATKRNQKSPLGACLRQALPACACTPACAVPCAAGRHADRRGLRYAPRESPHRMHRNLCPDTLGRTTICVAGRISALCSGSPLNMRRARIPVGFPVERVDGRGPQRFRFRDAHCNSHPGAHDETPIAGVTCEMVTNTSSFLLLPSSFLTSHRFYCPVRFRFVPEALRTNRSGKDVFSVLDDPIVGVLV